MMKFIFEPAEDMGMLLLNGKLTIDHAAKLKELLMESMEKANQVTIQIEKVTEVDLSCLQLLCSAHRTALNLKKNIILEQNGSRIFTDTVKAAGYSRSGGCALSNNKSCFWAGV